MYNRFRLSTGSFLHFCVSAVLFATSISSRCLTQILFHRCGTMSITNFPVARFALCSDSSKNSVFFIIALEQYSLLLTRHTKYAMYYLVGMAIRAQNYFRAHFCINFIMVFFLNFPFLPFFFTLVDGFFKTIRSTLSIIF